MIREMFSVMLAFRFRTSSRERRDTVGKSAMPHVKKADKITISGMKDSLAMLHDMLAVIKNTAWQSKEIALKLAGA